MQLLARFTAIALLACGIAACTSTRQTPASAYANQSRAATIVDVRTPGEYASGHLQGAVNIPLNEIDTGIQEVAKSKDTPLMVHCQSGGRSARAAAKLREMGYTNVTDLGSYAHAKAIVEGSN